jgi:hypothetical protein
MFTRRKSLFLFGASALGLVAASRGALAAEGKAMTTPGTGLNDPLFNQPYVDIDEWRDAPVRHRYVHGGFKGTEARFSFYFPPKEQYQGRFFQYVTPVPLSENLAQSDSGEGDKIGFAVASGGYFVETNQGGPAKLMGGDPTIGGYRVSAAAAQYSRVVAAQVYGSRQRPYGYIYGGSGGSFRTLACFENTTGVWDGAVPYVIGSPMAMPNDFTVRAHAMRILEDKFPAIVDAIDAGGSGDMYAGLDPEEREALAEVTRMGFPPRTWFAHERLGMGALTVLFDTVVMIDPTYFQDFWTVPGYLGANPPESLRRARIQHGTTLAQVVTAADAARMGLPLKELAANEPAGAVGNAWKSLLDQSKAEGPVGVRLASMPTGNLLGAKLLVKSGAAAGRKLSLGAVAGDFAMIRPIGGADQILKVVQAGDEVVVDNSDFLAIQTYHRHQVPTRDFYTWDQFRGPDGKPLYPQRPRVLGPMMAKGAVGALQTGRFQGKMIVVESLMDEDAFPWQADWYRSKVKEALGDRLDDHFRLWFTDHALHAEDGRPAYSTWVVPYVGVLHQALRDLSAWVETSAAPPASSRYKMVDGQVEVPPTAAARRGVQPVVTVTANRGVRANAAVGQPVEFHAVIEAPPKTGSIVAAEWDFEGRGDFPVAARLTDARASRVTLKATHAFSKPGTYFAVLRATSHRVGNRDTRYARVQNLGRVRVVVT